MGIYSSLPQTFDQSLRERWDILGRVYDDRDPLIQRPHVHRVAWKGDACALQGLRYRYFCSEDSRVTSRVKDNFLSSKWSQLTSQGLYLKGIQNWRQLCLFLHHALLLLQRVCEVRRLFVSLLQRRFCRSCFSSIKAHTTSKFQVLTLHRNGFIVRLLCALVGRCCLCLCLLSNFLCLSNLHASCVRSCFG